MSEAAKTKSIVPSEEEIVKVFLPVCNQYPLVDGALEPASAITSPMFPPLVLFKVYESLTMDKPAGIPN